MLKSFVLSSFLLLIHFLAFSQNETIVKGKVIGENSLPLVGATVYVEEGFKYATGTNEKGAYSLNIKEEGRFNIVCTFVGYDTLRYSIKAKNGSSITKDFKLNSISVDVGFNVTIKERRADNIVKLDAKNVDVVAGPKQSVESLIKTLPGVTSNNEMSSQYSVRGGNYDENLVYVNDFEIYRPQLIRASQQEGLSFVNSDMISSIYFSPGGFQSIYGDKMSSVLDIQYKRPEEGAWKINTGILDQGIYRQGVGMDRRFRYQFAVRRQSNQYLLLGNDVQGEYRPRFYDVQGYSTYRISPNMELGILTYFSDNQFKMVPQSQRTKLGTVQNVKSFNVVFDGQEISRFQTGMGGISLKYFDEPSGTTLKWLTSAYISNEDETYDIIGYYRLNEVDADLGSDEFAEDEGTVGFGSFHNWARNFLDIAVVNTALKGAHVKGNHKLLWGLKYQREMIIDEMLEWVRLDSAGYSIPFSNEEVNISSYIQSQYEMNSSRYTSYFQDNYSWEKDSVKYNLSAGIRHQYWSFTDQHLVSPRTQFSFIPNWKRDVRFRAAMGIYFQPGFYREFRDFDGSVNRDIKAQKSFHYALGADMNLKIWERPFVFSSEVYYKYMTNLIPFEVDNVKIRYHAENNAVGYARGLDLRMNGEFVPGVESWVSLSFLDTKENLNNDVEYHHFDADGNRVSATSNNIERTETVYPGYIPRPTDQRITFNMFFQDYLPNNENFKVSLNLLFGSGYNYGPPDHQRSKDTLSMPPYRRVDIGFSSLLLDGKKGKYKDSRWKGIKSIWATLEVFNLLAVKNTVSYYWIKDVNNLMYPVPNYLTSRRVNLRIITKL